MTPLIQLFLRIRNFLLFFLLEVFCFWLIVRNNDYWDVTFFNTSNYVVAKTLEKNNRVCSYINLQEVNQSLASENNRLNAELARLRQYAETAKMDSLNAGVAARYDYKVAKVVNNTIGLVNNFITIDKGSADGIEAGMGVISATGIVGRVKSCGEHYSVVYSILHSKFDVSAKIKQKVELIGTGKWAGKNPKLLSLLYVDRYKTVKKGDSVLTSNYNSVFPPDILVGRVQHISTRPDQPFYDLEVAISTDFPNLQYVYVVDNRMKKQQEAIETATKTEQQ